MKQITTRLARTLLLAGSVYVFSLFLLLGALVHLSVQASSSGTGCWNSDVPILLIPLILGSAAVMTNLLGAWVHKNRLAYFLVSVMVLLQLAYLRGAFYHVRLSPWLTDCHPTQFQRWITWFLCFVVVMQWCACCLTFFVRVEGSTEGSK